MELGSLPNVESLTVSNGEVGTAPQRSSQMVKEWIEEHDLVISKGRGNYEGLSEQNGIFFMLMAKRPIIASDLDVDAKSIILRFKQ